MVSSLRMHATNAIFLGFPAAASRVENSLITGLWTLALSAASRALFATHLPRFGYRYQRS